MNKSLIGKYGEEQAVNYLRKQGYVILERNYLLGKNEVDIICEKRGVIVFVEVKKRQTNKFGTPLDTIGQAKIGNIIKAAHQYLCKRKLLDKSKIRFDVITICGDKLEHIEDALA